VKGYKFKIVKLDLKLKMLVRILIILLIAILIIIRIFSIDFRWWLAAVVVVVNLGVIISSYYYENSAVVVGDLWFEDESMFVSINDIIVNFKRNECDIKLVNAGYKGMNTANPFTMVGFFRNHCGNVLMKVKNQNSSLKYHLQVSNKYEYNELMKNVKKGD
jgi:hypothetical protein